ncbi:DUF3592 domain-containing protein [Pseudomonas sp. TE3610]
MSFLVLFKVFAAIAGTLWSAWRTIKVLRMTEGSTVEGRVTYVEGKPGIGGQPLLTFSYTANGQRFHKTWNETLDRNSQTKLMAAISRYNRGDTIEVWHAKADPEVCCIGPRVAPLEYVKGKLAEWVENLAALFR